MDTFQAANVVHERILELEPEPIARKIVGYVYLQEYPDQEMIRLALGPDSLIQSLIGKAKSALQLPSLAVSPSGNPISIPDHSLRYVCFPSTSPRFRVLPPRLAGARHWYHTQTERQPLYKSDYRLQNQFIASEDQIEPSGSGATGLGAFNNLRRSQNLKCQTALEVPVKMCHYFVKGFCKHGSNCRYFHGQSLPENYSREFDPNSHEFGYDDQLISPGSVEKLEMEITEILKSRGGNPVSIASLPMLYYERYRRTLQAEGYLTESQRHGKAGFSLTKLLARLKSCIRLIDRPHGQHAIILAEDAPKYLGARVERSDPGPIGSGSRQIYLTFPAESTFSEEGVSDYFSTFGAVQDVRIPCQQKRMFGFVTFASSDTVNIILAKGNPHFVCGARVLVKPYRERKSRLWKFHEKLDSQNMDINSELQARLLRKQLMEADEKALEIEMARLSNLKLAMDEQNVSQFYQCGVPSTTHPDSTQGFNLPDSPFASAVASSISAVI